MTSIILGAKSSSFVFIFMVKFKETKYSHVTRTQRPFSRRESVEEVGLTPKKIALVPLLRNSWCPD